MTFLHKDGLNAPSMQPYDEVQTIDFGGTVTGGTYTLTFSGQTTAAIQWNATAAQVQAALVALSNIESNDITVTGGPGPTDLVVTFTDPDKLGSRDVANMTATSSLTGTTPTVAIVNTRAGGGKKPASAS